ncbi:hypothetical protein VST7929_01381 [Vibrio stylophorae]|uniref:Co-chaperone DjlA N-terminal domain-containing protein n=1 Tax=Vibrio stylophorae TaxID=659351 RepID=A0ABM8ZT71_9VIBR|nr:TerB family tellurite resistance protein [Vibrio stylophorae]CAH0533511.1 hypothetical protein VST7929_01381 [Vibrio stylophorae]
MFHQLKRLLRQALFDGSSEPAMSAQQLHLAVAGLLWQVSEADHQQDERELAAKQSLLKRLFELTDEEVAQLLEKAQTQSAQAVSLFDFTTQLRSLSEQTRFDLVVGLWQVAYADGVLDAVEEAVIRQVSDLLYVNHQDFIRAKLVAQTDN